MTLTVPFHDAGTVVKLGAWRVVAEAAVRTELADVVSSQGNAVLMYHSVGEPYGNPRGPLSASRLRDDLTYLRERFHIVDLPEVLESGDAPRLAVTFDDGYRNFFTQALPVLESLDVPATLFVVTDLVGANQHDPREYGFEIDRNRMLSEAQMRAVADHDLVTLGNHTATHPSLPDIDRDSLHREVVGAREALERRYGVDATRFCYPGGKYDPQTRRLVGQTHEIGVGVSRGLIDPPLSAERTATLPRVNGARARSIVRWEVSGLGEAIRRRYHRFRR